jgi:D-alanyl-D-alanine-carboxypeptidase/D-alanyl-D-alanine-endopeptidase
MKYSALSLLIAVLLPAILSAQTIKRIDGSAITGDSLTAKIEYLMKAANVCGAAVSVFNDNQPVYSKTFGYADVPKHTPWLPNSELYACSLSKAVFAYVVMQLVQDKVIDLDKPLVDYLPKPLTEYKISGYKQGYQDLVGDDRYKKITARMCLDHTTGFPNWRWFEPDMKLRIKYDPGTRYGYSGEGIYLLQFVIEQITGKDYAAIAQEKVFGPLQMTGTSQVWQPAFDDNICYGHNAYGKHYPLKKWTAPNAAGSMTTTLADYTKFFTALINHQGLTPESFEAMTNTQVLIRSKKQFGPGAFKDSTLNDSIRLGYGLGLGVFYTPYGRAFFKEGHDDGWGHYTICYPDKKIAIIIMTNNDNGESIFKDLLAYAIGDVYTPWRWENYIPYEQLKVRK